MFRKSKNLVDGLIQKETQGNSQLFIYHQNRLIFQQEEAMDAKRVAESKKTSEELLKRAEEQLKAKKEKAHKENREAHAIEHATLRNSNVRRSFKF